MNDIINELNECIFEHCLMNDISADIRFAHFGNENKFHTNGTDFSLDCLSYYADDIEDLKQFFVDYIDTLWEHCTPPMNRIALYIKDIVDMDTWYEVIVGAGLFTDEALL